MATETSSNFPLATDIFLEGDASGTTAPGVGVGDDAGASGDSYANSVSLSTGGIIAIVVVVVVVSILGGMYPSPSVTKTPLNPLQPPPPSSSSSQRKRSGPSRRPSGGLPARSPRPSLPGGPSFPTLSRTLEVRLAPHAPASPTTSRPLLDCGQRTSRRDSSRRTEARAANSVDEREAGQTQRALFSFGVMTCRQGVRRGIFCIISVLC
jgi:hypothetical protein